MEKLVYLLFDDGPAADRPTRGDVLRDRLLGETVPDLLALNARRITVNVHDTEAALATVSGLSRPTQPLDASLGRRCRHPERSGTREPGDRLWH